MTMNAKIKKPSFEHLKILFRSVVECRGRTPYNTLLRNSNKVRIFWHDSFLIGRFLLTSLGSVLFPTFTEKKTATVSQLFNSCLPGVDNLIYTKLIGSSGM